MSAAGPVLCPVLIGDGERQERTVAFQERPGDAGRRARAIPCGVVCSIPAIIAPTARDRTYKLLTEYTGNKATARQRSLAQRPRTAQRLWNSVLPTSPATSSQR
jgi:hypothetical protein